MRAAITRQLVFTLALLCFASVADAQVSVKGYYRKDGTYVRPHYRSNPDGNFWNNWSTKGNVNPYTGKPGTKVTPPSGSDPDSPASPTSASNPHQPPTPSEIRERWRLEDEARERHQAKYSERRSVYLKYSQSRSDNPEKDAAIADVSDQGEPKIDRLSLMRPQRPYVVVQPESVAAALREHEARKRAEQLRYQELVRESARYERLKASGYTSELYPNLR